MQDLEQMLGSFILFKVFPNAENPQGIEFYPKVRNRRIYDNQI